MRAIPGLLTLLVLVGCAALDEEEPAVPASQVTIYREPSLRDSLFPMLFTVDGQVVAQLQPEEKVSFEVPAGNHRFEYELGVYNCSKEVQLRSSQAYFYRLAQGCVIEQQGEQ